MLPLHFNSMGENRIKPILNTLKHRDTGRIHTLNQKIATSVPSSWTQGHFRSWKVTGSFSAITFNIHQLKRWKYLSCAQDCYVQGYWRRGIPLCWCMCCHMCVRQMSCAQLGVVNTTRFSPHNAYGENISACARRTDSVPTLLGCGVKILLSVKKKKNTC